MKVKELFEHLTSGEFQSMAIGGNNQAGIQESDWPKIVPILNVALGEIHKRFPMKLNYLIVQMFDHIGDYHLNTRYSATNTSSPEPYKYIMDSQFDPFDDNDVILCIDKVFHEDGTEAYLNDENSTWSLYTPSEKTLQVPYADRDNAYTVQYRANHKKIIIHPLLLDEEIDISFTYVTPLLYSMAQRYFATKGELGMAQSNMYGSKFELACRDIETRGLTTSNETTNMKLVDNGWV